MTFWIVTGSILLSAAIALMFSRIHLPAAIPAYAGLWMLYKSRIVVGESNEILFWGIAAVIVAAIAMLSSGESDAVFNAPRKYIATGALAGMAVGLLSISHGGSVIGSATGAILGLVAFSNTPSGRTAPNISLNRKASAVIQPTVTCSIIGAALKILIRYGQSI